MTGSQDLNELNFRLDQLENDTAARMSPGSWTPPVADAVGAAGISTLPFDVVASVGGCRMFIPEDADLLAKLLGEEAKPGRPDRVSARVLWQGGSFGWVDLGDVSGVVSVAIGRQSADGGSDYLFCIVAGAGEDLDDLIYRPVAVVSDKGVQQLFHGAVGVTGHFGKLEENSLEGSFETGPGHRASGSVKIPDLCSNLGITLDGEDLVFSYDSWDLTIDTHGVVRGASKKPLEIVLDLRDLCG